MYKQHMRMAPWGRNLLPQRLLRNAEGEMPCWYPFATEQFRLGLSYDLIPRLAAGGSVTIKPWCFATLHPPTP